MTQRMSHQVFEYDHIYNCAIGRGCGRCGTLLQVRCNCGHPRSVHSVPDTFSGMHDYGCGLCDCHGFKADKGDTFNRFNMGLHIIMKMKCACDQ